jgi:TonB family protein
VKQWKYKPYLLNGEPIAVATQIRVEFLINGKGPDGVVQDHSGGVIGDALRYAVPPDTTLRVSEVQMRQLRTEKVYPVYPPLAVQVRLQGTVTLHVLVNASGDVENVKLISGHPMLSPPAIEAVKQWKYQPYVKDGNAVPFAGMVRLNFNLGSGDVVIVSEPPVVDLSPLRRPGVPQRVRVSSGVSQGLLVNKVSPEYPADAREQHIQGVVILQVNIDKEGNVNNVELISGHPLLAPAAIEAVKQWKYKPYLLNGEPVEVDTQVQVNFTLTQ